MADFNWKDIAGPLAKIGAPVLGTLIGGPAGAAMGKVAGEVLAGALGVPADPESVAQAIEDDPVRAKEAANSAEMATAIANSQAEIIKTVNETYRIELQQESWVARLWRPVWGWAGCVIWSIHGMAYAKALWFKDFDMIRTIPDMTVFYGVMGAIVGVAVWGRTSEKKSATAAGAPDAIAEALGAIVRKAVKK